VGLLSGVFLVVSALSGVAVVTTLFTGSAFALMSVPSSPVAHAIVTIAVMAAATVANIRGVRLGARIVEMLTVAKLVPLLAFVIIGAAFIEPGNLTWTAAPDAGAVLGTSGIVIFAFMGIESAVGPSGEVHEPARTVPRAVFLALLAVCLLYLSVQAVAQGILGPALGSTRITPLAAAADAAIGEPGRIVMLAGAVVSILGFLFGAGLANPRIVFALARDGFLPRTIAGVHPIYRTPHNAIIICALLVVAMSLTGTFERLLIISNITALVVYGMVAMAAVVLQRRDTRSGGEPFRCPGGPLVHLLALGGIVWMLWAIVTRQDAIGLAILLAVTAVAYVVRRRRVRRT
jgi:amino acid transporter